MVLEACSQESLTDGGPGDEGMGCLTVECQCHSLAPETIMASRPEESVVSCSTAAMTGPANFSQSYDVDVESG